MIVAWEGVVFWGALAVSAALGVSAHVHLYLLRREAAEARRLHLADVAAIRERADRDRNTIDNEVASYLNLSREQVDDLKGRFEKFKDQVEGDLDDISADLDVIETSVASCVRASRASPFSSLNLQFLNDGLDDVRARLAALELAAQKARLASQGMTEEQRPLWLVQRERAVPQEAARPAAPAAARAATDASPAPQQAQAAPAPVAAEAKAAPRPRASFADWLSPSEIAVNEDPPGPEDAEPLNWPGSLGRIAAF